MEKLTMKCPICEAPATWKDNPHRPFCSERCRMIDLGNWMDEEYNVPLGETETLAPEAEEDV